MIAPSIKNAEIIIKGGNNPKRYAIIDKSTGKCVNITSWDPDSEPNWSPGEGFDAIQDDTIEIDPPPPVVPEEITNFQCRAMMMRMPGKMGGPSLFVEVDGAIKQLNGEAYMAWEYANTVKRHGVLTESMASQFGFNSEEIDVLFIEASKIEA